MITAVIKVFENRDSKRKRVRLVLSSTFNSHLASFLHLIAHSRKKTNIQSLLLQYCCTKQAKLCLKYSESKG